MPEPDRLFPEYQLLSWLPDETFFSLVSRHHQLWGHVTSAQTHARRKFFDLHATGKSQIADTALELLGKAYDIEREVKDATADERKAVRQQRTGAC